jgi:hypothetical protein
VHQGTHSVSRSNIRKITVSGNSLVPEVPDIATFTALLFFRINLMGRDKMGNIRQTGYCKIGTEEKEDECTA